MAFAARGSWPSALPFGSDHYVADNAELKRLSLGALEAEIGRIQRLIDINTAYRLKTISTKKTEMKIPH